MKLGAENRNTLIAAIVLAVIAVFMLWRTFFSSSGPVVAGAPPTPTAANAAPTNAGPPARRIQRGHGRSPAQTPVTATLDPRLQLNRLKPTEETEYKGGGRNIFDKQSEIAIPQPVRNPVVVENKNPLPSQPQGPPPPPPPPPINLKFFGLLNRPGEPRQAFLLQNDDVFVAKEGDVVNRRYKVVKINNNSVEIEDLLGNNRQTIPLTAG